MSTATTLDTPFLHAQRDQLAVLLDALDGVVISDAERRSLAWLAGWEKHTVENVAAVIRRARAAGEASQAAASIEPAQECPVGGGRRLCLHADDDRVAPHWWSGVSSATRPRRRSRTRRTGAYGAGSALPRTSCSATRCARAVTATAAR